MCGTGQRDRAGRDGMGRENLKDGKALWRMNGGPPSHAGWDVSTTAGAGAIPPLGQWVKGHQSDVSVLSYHGGGAGGGGHFLVDGRRMPSTPTCDTAKLRVDVDHRTRGQQHVRNGKAARKTFRNSGEPNQPGRRGIRREAGSSAGSASGI